MSREQQSNQRRKRIPTRRKGSRPSAVSSPGERRSRGSAKRGAGSSVWAAGSRKPGTSGPARRGGAGRGLPGARQYRYATDGVLPRLRLRATALNASRLIALSLAGVMMALLVWFFVDERFYVYGAEVRGNSLVSADEVYQASGLQTMSIFYIDSQKVAQNIACHIPSVTHVHVQCQLPGRVSIRVSEEDVQYIWRVANAAFLADVEGQILKEDDGAHAGLVIVQDLDNKPVQPGSQVDRVALNTAGQLHRFLPEVQVFEYSAARGVSLSDARGWRVYFGDDQRLPEKVATLQALLFKLEQEHKTAKVIDLRFAGSPYYQ